MSKRRACLYSLKNSVLKPCYGTIESLSMGRAIFRGDDGRKIYCSDKFGYVQYGNLWFYHRNDELAVELLIKYELEQINQLNVRICRHQKTIERLRKGVKDGSN